MTTTYTIIIPTKNYSNLIACLAALRSHGENGDVIVVDDSDGPMDTATLNTLAELGRDRLAFVQGKKPFCFGRNINIGTRACNDDVVWLNDDAILESQFGLAGLSCAAQRNPTYACISAAVSGYANVAFPIQDQTVRHAMITDSVVRNRRTVPFVCVYIPRAASTEIGSLDERFTGYAPVAPILCPQCGWSTDAMKHGQPLEFAKGDYAAIQCAFCALPLQIPIEEVYGGEDDDWCYRVRRAGLQVGIFDGCVVNHASLPSTFRPDGRGRSVAGARARFYQIHGVSMGVA